MVLLKLVAKDMLNRGLQLQPGLNTDPVPFSETGDCVAGGIYYCDAAYIIFWIDNLDYTHMCTVTVPEDARTVALHLKYRSDKVILGIQSRIIQFGRMERPVS